MATQVSPFQDNITVNLNGFPITHLSMQYSGDNGVNIWGPEEINTTNGGFTFHIASQNFSDDGFPTLTINMPAENTSCTLRLNDGPWAYLAYKNSSAPHCAHMKVSPIMYDDQYRYTINLTYK